MKKHRKKTKSQISATEIIFILDRSGSMNICEDDAIGGYNSFLDTQKREKSSAFITTVLFDNHYEVIHNHVDIQKIKHITKNEYFARGTTALLDAIGVTIENASKFTRYIKDKVIMIIITDGLDNSSVQFYIEDIYTMIQKQQKLGWEFIFLGANIDAIKTAGSIGITPDRASNFTTANSGVKHKFNEISRTITQFRSTGRVSGDWR